MNLILLFISLTVAAPHGPCARKLQATGDRAEDTTQFTMYLELLLHERVIELKDSDSFLKELDQGKITNPISNPNANKQFSFHHGELQTLLQAKTIDLEMLKRWVQTFIQKTETTEKKKDQTHEKTKEAPYIAPDGSMFYKFKHARLGEIYKILKPGGHYNNEQDWDPTLWAVSALVDEKGDALLLKNEGGQNSPARNACLSLGKGIDLPSEGDYVGLANRMSPAPSGLGFTEKYLFKGTEIRKIFKKMHSYMWTLSTSSGENKASGIVFETGVANTIGDQLKIAHGVLCVGRLKEVELLE